MSMQGKVLFESAEPTSQGSVNPRFTVQIKFKRLLPGTDLWESKEVCPHPEVPARNMGEALARGRQLADVMLNDGRAAKLFD